LLPGHDSLNGEKDDEAHEGRYCEQLDVNVPAGIVMYQASEKAARHRQPLQWLGQSSTRSPGLALFFRRLTHGVWKSSPARLLVRRTDKENENPGTE
jgi:hypothetical protein